MTGEDTTVESGVPATDTGTPLLLPAASVNDALDSLEFAQVLERIASHAAGPLGAATIRARRPTADAGWIESELAVVNQATSLIRTRQGIAAEPVPDLTRALGRLGVEGSVLEIGEMIAIRRTLVAARLVTGELKRWRRMLPCCFN